MACRHLELLADMLVKDWSQTIITLCCHKRMLSQGPNGMRPVELLAEMQKGLEPCYRHHIQCRMLSRGPNGMRPLEILAEMQVKDWSQRVMT